MPVLALDVGGANLKASDGRQFCATHPFELWRRPGELAAAPCLLAAEAPPAERWVATMTGELADCFATKAEGVATIVTALESAAAGRDLAIYLTDGRFVPPAVAIAEPLRAAAANWHALARFAGRYAQGGCGLLIDVGSTTTDVIPLVDAWPAAQGLTDPERLLSGELIYTGVERTPVCGLVEMLPWAGRTCPVAREVFATALDAYLILEDLPEQPDNRHTADGRPATRLAARDRLARQICADRSMFSRDDALAAARTIAERQRGEIARALTRVIGRRPKPPPTVILSGRGEFLARRAVDELGLAAEVVTLSDRLGSVASTAATAYALAVLAGESSINAATGGTSSSGHRSTSGSGSLR